MIMGIYGDDDDNNDDDGDDDDDGESFALLYELCIVRIIEPHYPGRSCPALTIMPSHHGADAAVG